MWFTIRVTIGRRSCQKCAGHCGREPCRRMGGRVNGSARRIHQKFRNGLPHRQRILRPPRWSKTLRYGFRCARVCPTAPRFRVRPMNPQKLGGCLVFFLSKPSAKYTRTVPFWKITLLTVHFEDDIERQRGDSWRRARTALRTKPHIFPGESNRS